MISPTQRTLKYLRDKGYTAQVVEHWHFYAKKRIDLFGIIDIVAIHPDQIGVTGIQCTAHPNGSTRMNKALAEPRLKIWLDAGNQFYVYEWKKGELKIL